MVTSSSLHPVVEDVGMRVAVLLKLGETRSIAVVARADVDRSKVADDAGSPVVHVVVLDVEHVTSSVALALLHWSSHPGQSQLEQKSASNPPNLMPVLVEPVTSFLLTVMLLLPSTQAPAGCQYLKMRNGRNVFEVKKSLPGQPNPIEGVALDQQVPVSVHRV